MKWLTLLILTQNINVTPIETRQNGVRVPQRVVQRQYVIDCRANMTCAVDAGVLFLSSSGGGSSGKVAEAYTADASITAQRFEANPTDCAATEYATAIDSSGNLTCSTPPGGSGSGTSFEQQVTLTAAGFFQQAVSLAATTATSKFVCRPFGTDDAGLTAEAIAVAGLQVTVSDLSAGVGLNINIFNPYGLEGIVTIHCTTGG